MRRRKLKNYLSNAKLSVRYHYRLMLMSLIFMFVALLYILQIVRDIIKQVGFIAANDVVAANYINELVNHLLVVVSLSFVIYFLMSVLFVLFVEQRIGGPTVAVLKFIEELKKGNYDYRRKLRTGDELDGIMQGLQELQDQLKANQKQ